MERRNEDPGAVQYGNFMNYYTFHSASERVDLLPSANVWLPSTKETGLKRRSEPYLVLDVGCNCGVFTQLLHSFLEQQLQCEVHVLGVDIDERLIERANEDLSDSSRITYIAGDVLDEENFDSKVLDFLVQHKRTKFDAICCYSITMWIHLNHHDSGLQLFLRKLSQLAELFVVEPQPWKCYKTARRRMSRAGDTFPLFAELKWRDDVAHQIQKYLEVELGLRNTYTSPPTKWQRSICFYR